MAESTPTPAEPAATSSAPAPGGPDGTEIRTVRPTPADGDELSRAG